MGRRRRTALWAAAAAACWPLVSCSNACPAIGWVNSVSIEVEGDAGAVQRLELCADGSCSTRAADEKSGFNPVDPPFPSASAADPSSDAGLGAGAADANTWEFFVDMSAPDSVMVRAWAASGEILAEQDFPLDWKRVGGSERCGGPMSTPPLRLRI